MRVTEGIAAYDEGALRPVTHLMAESAGGWYMLCISAPMAGIPGAPAGKQCRCFSCRCEAAVLIDKGDLDAGTPEIAGWELA